MCLMATGRFFFNEVPIQLVCLFKRFSFRDWDDSIKDRMLASHVIDPGSMPRTTNDLLSPARSDP